MTRPTKYHSSNRIATLRSRPLTGSAKRGVNPGFPEEVEQSFREAMREPLSQAEKIGEADIVVGIPFYNEADTIASVLKTVRKGLEQFYPEQKCVIVAAGSPAGKKALKAVNAIRQSDKIVQIAFLLNDEKINGKGWALRAIMEISRILNADLAIVEADLKNRKRDGELEGLAPDWVSLLLEPIRKQEMDLVISRFNRHYLEFPISAHLLYPLLAAVYNCPVHDLRGGQWGISHQLLPTYVEGPWSTNIEIGGYGVDSWLITTAITSGARICEANLGIKIPGASERTEAALRQILRVLFDQIIADREWWAEEGRIGTSLLPQPLASIGVKKSHRPDEVQINPQQLVARYNRGFIQFCLLYKRILPKEVYRQLEALTETKPEHFDFPTKLWVDIVFRFLLCFAFNKKVAKGDLLNSFIPLYQGRVAGFALEMQALKAKLASLASDEAEHLTSLEAERHIEGIVDEFLRQKSAFLTAWGKGAEALKPPVPKVTYHEFIPGVPLVVPLELTNPKGETVTAQGVYDSIFYRYKKEFEQFVYERLKFSRQASSSEMAERIRDFMRQVEKAIDKTLLPGDLSTVEGTREAVDAVFRHISRHDVFSLTPEMAYWLLQKYPPSTLLTKLGCNNIDALIDGYESNDVLALASWTEDQEYAEQIWAAVRENARPEHFTSFPLKPLVVNHEQFPSLVEMKQSGALSRLAGRLVVGNLPKGTGGDFPKLRYFTTIAKNIIEAERFSRIWQRFAEQRGEFGDKVINSLEGHWGKGPLSAHNIFESGHQQVFVEQLREMAQRIAQEGGGDAARSSLATYLKDAADSHHLALRLADGTFIPCSIWTWASYSFKGGRGWPTPLSLFVERDWASREFITEYFKAIGGKEETIEERIVELIEEGREWEDLAHILLGRAEEAEEVIPEQVVTVEQPPAGSLAPSTGNPLLESIKEHPWESKYVFNTGAVKLNGRVYLIYRAVGEDDVSRLGLAASEDGFKFTERLEEPIFEPKGKSEKKGCEDPRLTVIDNRIYMLYTAYDGLVAQIALASIAVDDFLNYRWGAWQRHGLVFPGFTDKNAALFPEQFAGRFAMLHRVEPHIWITFSPHLSCPWSRREHKILAGSMSGMMWDGKKIGAGAQPLKTKYGWLLITHGVDYAHTYRLGVMLLDLANPTILRYRSPNPILEPAASCEIGKVSQCQVHNVVFTCGAVSQDDNRKILNAEDEVLVYYGAEDAVVCLATAKISDLVPAQYRES